MEKKKEPVLRKKKWKGFTSFQYDKIETDDGTLQADQTSQRRYYAIHLFKFNIAEPEAIITKLDVLWDGGGYRRFGTHGATLYIRDFETGKYEQLDRKTDVYITLEGTIADNIGDYIDDDGSLIIIAEQNSAQWRFWRWTFRSQLGTDYVKVDVTSTPKTHVVILNVAPSSTEVNPGDDMTFEVEVRETMVHRVTAT